MRRGQRTRRAERAIIPAVPPPSTARHLHRRRGASHADHCHRVHQPRRRRPGPGGPDEDKDGGFAHGGGRCPFFDPDGWARRRRRASGADALLFGRWTGRSWPPRGRRAGDPFADQINASEVRRRHAALGDDVVGVEHDRLGGRRRPRPRSASSERRARTCRSWAARARAHADREHASSTSYGLMIEPVLLGGGKSIFPEDGGLRTLQLRLRRSRPRPATNVSIYSVPRRGGRRWRRGRPHATADSSASRWTAIRSSSRYATASPASAPPAAPLRLGLAADELLEAGLVADRVEVRVALRVIAASPRARPPPQMLDRLGRAAGEALAAREVVGSIGYCGFAAMISAGSASSRTRPLVLRARVRPQLPAAAWYGFPACRPGEDRRIGLLGERGPVHAGPREDERSGPAPRRSPSRSKMARPLRTRYSSSRSDSSSCSAIKGSPPRGPSTR